MPRSGSTLMQNILAQNPDIHATPTDGFLELIYGARINYTNNPEFKAQDPKQMQSAWRGFCLEGMKGYCKGLSNKPHTCIKSRGIGEYYRWFESFMGESPKVIVMVRDMRDIISSMEKMFRSNSEKHNDIRNPSEMRGLTTQTRTQQWMASQPIGLAMQRLEQIHLEKIIDKCVVVRYEDLCLDPQSIMEGIYNYLGFSHFQHDFNNVEQVTKEDDIVYGLAPDLHKIKRKIVPNKRDALEILGEQTCAWIDKTCHAYQKFYNYI